MKEYQMNRRTLTYSLGQHSAYDLLVMLLPTQNAYFYHHAEINGK